MSLSHLNLRSDLLEEYSTLEYILLGDLRDLLQEPADEETCRWLLAVLDALLETLPREFDLKQQDGYLLEVLENYPNWSGAVERLQIEHNELFLKLKELRGRISQRISFAEIADEARRELKDWMLTLIAYHRHENRLLQTALNLEVGVGD